MNAKTPPKASTQKKPPISNGATTGKPSTTSGHAVVHQGKLSPKNSNDTRTASSRTPPNGKTPSNTGTVTGTSNTASADNPDLRRMAKSLHRLADQLYRGPDLMPDPERGTGPRSRLKDERLYAGQAPTATKATAANKPPARTSSSRTTRAR